MENGHLVSCQRGPVVSAVSEVGQPKEKRFGKQMLISLGDAEFEGLVCQ